MFLYNINYDKESNTISGDKIVIPEGVSTNSRIALSADIENKYDVFIDFNMPKCRKIRSERMQFDDGKYYLTIPDIVAVSAGCAEIQLIFISDEYIEKSLINAQLLLISPSINAVDTQIKADKTIIDTLFQENSQQNLKLSEHENKLNAYNLLIGEHDNTLNNNTSHISEHEDRLKNNDLQISEHKVILDNHASLIGEHEDRMKNNDLLISENINTLNSHASLINENKNTLNNHTALISECQTVAEANKFVVETIYDKSSSSSSLNHGFPNGLFKGNRINGLNLSKYRYLIINCQDDRTMTMFMDLTEKNYLNNFYINSMSGTKENNKNFATISFEVIINLNKTYFHLNNAVCSSGFSVTKELVTSTLLNISKVTGII